MITWKNVLKAVLCLSPFIILCVVATMVRADVLYYLLTPLALIACTLIGSILYRPKHNRRAEDKPSGDNTDEKN